MSNKPPTTTDASVLGDDEVTEHIQTIWFVMGDNVDWMATSYKRQGDPTWRFRYRWRYYADGGDPFAHRDRKSVWSGTDNHLGLEHMERALDSLAWKMALEWNAAPERFLVDGPPIKLHTMKNRPPWMHLKWTPIS